MQRTLRRIKICRNLRNTGQMQINPERVHQHNPETENHIFKHHTVLIRDYLCDCNYRFFITLLTNGKRGFSVMEKRVSFRDTTAFTGTNTFLFAQQKNTGYILSLRRPVYNMIFIITPVTCI